MPLVIPAGFAHVSIKYSVGGDSEWMVTTFGIEIPLNSDYQQVADAISTDWTNTIGAPGGWNVAYTFRGVWLRIGNGTPNSVIVENPETVPGTSNDPCPPSNCALLVKKQTGVGGRVGRGRMYIPAGILSEAGLDHNGTLTSGHLTAQQGKVNGFLTAVPEMRLLHDSASPGGTEPTPITGLVVDGRIATQRRRMRG